MRSPQNLLTISYTDVLPGSQNGGHSDGIPIRGRETMTRKLPAFDVLVDMARNDPDRLEVLRQQLTSQIIENASSGHQRKRLEGLQFRIDLERERARSPLAATIKLSEMMCHSLAELHRSMVTPLSDDHETAARPEPAKVLVFPAFGANDDP